MGLHTSQIFCTVWRKVELRPVTFLTAALPYPLPQHMGWLGGSSTRTAAPPPRRCGRKDHSGETALTGEKQALMYVSYKIAGEETCDRDREA